MDSVKQKFDELFAVFTINTVGRDPVAVPEKIFGLTLILDFFDRCHSLVSLTPPQAAVDSLPTGHAETYSTGNQHRRGEPVYSPVAHAIARAPSLEIVGAGYILPVAPPTGNAPAPKQ